MGDREQQVVDVAVETALTEGGGSVTGRGDDEPAFSGEGAVAVLARIARGVVQSVGEALGEDPVEPSLHHRRHAGPPQWKNQDDQVGVLQESLVVPDERVESALAPRIDRMITHRAVELGDAVVRRANHCILVQLIEIQQIHGVPVGA